MAASLKLVRRPRTRKMWPIVKKELNSAYMGLLLPAVAEKYEDVAELDKWDNKPTFKLRVKLSQKRILVECYVDMRFNASKRFKWVDFGTGLEGPTGSTYSIDVKVKGLLHFPVPYSPLTLPTNALRYDPTAPKHWVQVIHIDHPGIQARDFTAEVVKWVKKRNNTKGFYRITENAYRRAFRKMKRQG